MNFLQTFLGSKARAEILTLLALHQGERFHLREIQRRTGQDVNPLKKELDRLEKLGVVRTVMDGNRRYASINDRSPLYGEIRTLILKTFGLGDAIRDALKALSGIQFAFIYGSFAKTEETAESDIDLFIIGDIPSVELQKALGKSKAATGREIHSAVYPLKEIRARTQKKDPFIREVLQGRKIFLIGTEDEFKRSFKRAAA